MTTRAMADWPGHAAGGSQRGTARRAEALRQNVPELGEENRTGASPPHLHCRLHALAEVLVSGQGPCRKPVSRHLMAGDEPSTNAARKARWLTAGRRAGRCPERHMAVLLGRAPAAPVSSIAGLWSWHSVMAGRLGGGLAVRSKLGHPKFNGLG